MNLELEKNNYFEVEGFLHRDAALYAGREFKKDCVTQFAKPDSQVPNSPAIYGHHLIDQILISKIFYMNDLIGERLYPTYCYARWYKHGAELKPHIDAEACEVSVTVNLMGDPWPFFIMKPNNESVSITLKPGDAIVYKGMQADHWREPFEGKECIQAFLHYVKIFGPNYHQAFDLQRNSKGLV